MGEKGFRFRMFVLSILFLLTGTLTGFTATLAVLVWVIGGGVLVLLGVNHPFAISSIAGLAVIGAVITSELIENRQRSNSNGTD